jgi:hypothetical protein
MADLLESTIIVQKYHEQQHANFASEVKSALRLAVGIRIYILNCNKSVMNVYQIRKLSMKEK